MPVDIPIRIDRPKVNTITMKAYQPGKVPYRTVAMQPVQTCTPRWLSFRQNGHWIVLFSMIDPLDRFPAIAGFNKINHALFRFIHTLDAGERFFVHPCRNIRQRPCIRHANNFLITVSRFSPFLYLSNRTMTNTGTIFTIPKLNRLAFVCSSRTSTLLKPLAC